MLYIIISCNKSAMNLFIVKELLYLPLNFNINLILNL